MNKKRLTDISTKQIGNKTRHIQNKVHATQSRLPFPASTPCIAIAHQTHPMVSVDLTEEEHRSRDLVDELIWIGEDSPETTHKSLYHVIPISYLSPVTNPVRNYANNISDNKRIA